MAPSAIPTGQLFIAQAPALSIDTRHGPLSITTVTSPRWFIKRNDRAPDYCESYADCIDVLSITHQNGTPDVKLL